ncbi:MAG: ABC transporter permease [Chloroflexi bacterium]|nr:ABC transporter permease [Chloroflexota bacterium]
MVPIARRNLLAEKTRFFVAVGGVAFSVFLIILVQSLFLGFRESAGALIEDLPFELWVVQDGTFDLYHSTSLLPSDYAERLHEVPGIAEVQPVAGRQVRLEVGGESRREFLLAFAQPPSHQSGSHALLDLERLPAPGEIVVSDSLASSYHVGRGDRLTLGEEEFTVIGSTDESAGFRQFSFLSFPDAQRLFGLSGSVNWITVALADDASSREVAADIESRLPGVDVLDRQEFADRSRSEIDNFLPVLGVVAGIAFVVGAAVISLTIYTATIEKARDYGVMKAIGASKWQLYRVIIQQSLAVSLLGFATGVPMALGAGHFIARAVPEFVTLFEWQSVIGVLAVVLIMSIPAAWLPAHRVDRIDPAAVFRA